MSSKKTEHHVQLVSNASMDVYPDNVISEFTTKFAQNLELPGEWEVALHSCSYHRNWLNVLDPSSVAMIISIKRWHGDGKGNTLFIKGNVTLPAPGNYSSAERLIEAMNNTQFFFKSAGKSYMLVTKDFVDISFNKATQKVTFTWKTWGDIISDIVTIELSEKLAHMLGHTQLDENQQPVRSITVGSEHYRTDHYQEHSSWPLPPFTQNNIRSRYELLSPVNVVDVYNIFIYSDIVESSRLGDADAAYLFMVPAQGREGDYVYFPVQNLVYKKVVKPSLSSIHIKVADFSGARVKFNHGSGEFTCLLHFRKVG